MPKTTPFRTREGACAHRRIPLPRPGLAGPAPSAARLSWPNNIIQQLGTCNSRCTAVISPALPFTSSVPLPPSSTTPFGNTGDIIRAKGPSSTSSATRPTLKVDLPATSATTTTTTATSTVRAYFSGNAWTGVSQVYNITESVSPFSRNKFRPPAMNSTPSASAGWGECPFVQDECLQLPGTVACHRPACRLHLNW